jgi:hypothetical protein
LQVTLRVQPRSNDNARRPPGSRVHVEHRRPLFPL